MPGVSIENHWVAEADIPGLIAQADALVLPYREASQSGVIPIAHAMGVPVVAMPAGGLSEQVANQNRTDAGPPVRLEYIYVPEPANVGGTSVGVDVQAADADQAFAVKCADEHLTLMRKLVAAFMPVAAEALHHAETLSGGLLFKREEIIGQFG
jgi:glycosyltransferase involved in cell wall biosynthesis